jgi:hypothetical protein
MRATLRSYPSSSTHALCGRQHEKEGENEKRKEDKIEKEEEEKKAKAEIFFRFFFCEIADGE